MLSGTSAVGDPVCDEDGDLVEFVGTVIDITESKHSEEALRASEQVARGQVEALAQSLDVLATAPDPEKFIGQMLSTIGRLLNAKAGSCGYSTNRLTHSFCGQWWTAEDGSRAGSGPSIHEGPVGVEAEPSDARTAFHGWSGGLRRPRD